MKKLHIMKQMPSQNSLTYFEYAMRLLRKLDHEEEVDGRKYSDDEKFELIFEGFLPHVQDRLMTMHANFDTLEEMLYKIEDLHKYNRRRFENDVNDDNRKETRSGQNFPGRPENYRRMNEKFRDSRNKENNFKRNSIRKFDGFERRDTRYEQPSKHASDAENERRHQNREREENHPNANARVTTMKHCTHCQRPGHVRDDCWHLKITQMQETPKNNLN